MIPRLIPRTGVFEKLSQVGISFAIPEEEAHIGRDRRLV
jgi:hypothetical protein